MATQSIISAIDAEIANLSEARSVLAGIGAGASVTTKKAKKAPAKQAKKRTLSPEARARIASAQQKRWAKARKLAALSSIKATSKKAAKKAAKKAPAKAATTAKSEAPF